MALGTVDTTAALRRLIQSAAINSVAGTGIIPTTDKEHETLATNLGRLQIKQESHALLQSNVHVYIKTNINTRYSIEFCVHIVLLIRIVLSSMYSSRL